MLSTKISVDKTGLVFIFDNKTKLDIARNNKYDIIIKDAINDTYNINVSVKFQGLTISNEEANNEDPIDDLFKLAEQNQIIFNLEN